jgi:hypothetical protein
MTTNKLYNIGSIKEKLSKNGYVVIRNVLIDTEIEHTRDLFYKWWNSVEDLERLHNKIDPHGIFKHHQAGHQEHAWILRTNKTIVSIFKSLWETDELSVSFDGCCFIPKDCSKKDNIWTHTDQAPNSKGLKCYQGFVALTTNEERTLRVYKGSHLLHDPYFEERNINSSKNWNLIDKDYLKTINHLKRNLKIEKGSLVLWDSRTFHQNQYGAPMSEERIVQYLCYLPKVHENNTESQKQKKLKYFKELRTTSHWPFPVKVNGQQPQTWGDSSLTIDYDSLPKPNLGYMEKEIMELIQ